MCFDPVSLAVIGTVASVAGAGVSAVGQLQAGARANSIAQQNAIQMQRQGAYKARQVRRKAEYANAMAITQAGANGVRAGGSVLDVMADNAWQAETDAFNEIRFAESSASVQRQEGAAAQSRATFGAFGTLIGGVANFANNNSLPPGFLRTA